MDFVKCSKTKVRRIVQASAILLGVTFIDGVAIADTVAKSGHMQGKAQWVKQRLLEPRLPVGKAPPPAPKPTKPRPGLIVLANNDPVWRNARGNKPMHIGKTPYTRGLYCHAVSKVIVRLPAPGKTFTALVGVDTNHQTSGGRGSVVFSVTVKGKVAFKTKVIREGMPPAKVEVDLGDADEFVLEVGNAGDGISCDQSDWADAKVTLAGGKALWLGDMPLHDRRAQAVGIKPQVRRSNLPFSFIYGGCGSDDLLTAWRKTSQTEKLDNHRTGHTLTWADKASGLEVRCVALEYADFPAVEWTVYFRNTGKKNTPILANIQAMDAQIEREAKGEFVLRYGKGDTSRADLYQPVMETLSPKIRRRLAPAGGRPTNGAFPYYNLQTPGGGMFLAVGWPGQWAASFIRDEDRGLRIIAGQELTRLYLKPGEEIRTPLIALLFWRGDDGRVAQNLWRRWMIAHNLPRTADGKLPPPILHGNTSLEFNEMLGANEENQKYFIDRYREEKVAITFWWMDAGWYPCRGQWWNTGTWTPDKTRFPNGLRAISDHARKKGIKTLVWFEPERVTGGSWLGKNHPEWLLGGRLLNLGDPKARKWLTDHVDRTIREQGIDLYRQDFNMDPLGCWRGSDGPDRQGIAENLHVQGYLAYWDELRRRHKGLIIDSCASGGRRNDLETMRRAVPLHPTDFNYGHLPAKQAFHQSLLEWIPYFGSNTVPVGKVDPYAIRSGYAMSVTLGYDLRRKDLDCDTLRKLTGEWRSIVELFYGDYYPLTPYSLGEEKWIAWQFHRPKKGDGVVQAFRRTRNAEPVKILRLGGLDPDAKYEITDTDAGTSRTIGGKELTAKGLSVKIKGRGGAVVLIYKTAR